MQLKEIIPFVFLDIAIVVAAARLMGWVFRRLRQPAVIGEILAGILLGPTLLGLFPGDLHLVLFPPPVLPYLSVIAQIGLVLFMFIIGLEVDLSLVAKRRRTATAVSLSSIALPFVLGLLLATVLYPRHNNVGGTIVQPLAFALFLGAAMSITAFPVLARILAERNMQRTPTGTLALACAAIDDVVAWSLLAVVVAVGVGGEFTGVAQILLLTVAYALVMFLVVRPLLGRLAARYKAAGRLTPDVLAIMLVGVLLSAWTTELIGVHAIFGAFVFGAMMPRSEPGLVREVLQRLEQVAVLLLLPVFFVVAGLQVNVGAIGLAGLGELGLILLVAIGGKFIGATVAARLQRVPNRQAAALGLLMNTRGLTEIVILQVGLQLGVLDGELFTLMVIMALVTTIMTEPLLRLVYPNRIVRREIATAERAELGDEDEFTVLVAVPEDTGEVRGLMAGLGRGLLGREQPARVVLCRLLPVPVELELASGLGSDLATIAAEGDKLRALARRVEDEGAQCVVIVRFAPNPAAALTELATTLRADVLLVPALDGDMPAFEQVAGPDADLGGEFEAAVAVLWPSPAATAEYADPDRPVRIAVLTDGTPAARAALRLGGQLALYHGVPLAVGGTDDRRGGRRAGAALAALSRRGLDAVELADGEVPDVLLVPEGATAPAASDAVTVMHVRPAAVDLDEDLDQALGRIALPTLPTT